MTRFRQLLGPMEPNAIPGLESWLDSTRVAALSGGDPLSTWVDATGLGRSFSQTGTARPTFRTGIQAGKPAIYFDGVNDGLASSYGPTLGDFTIVAVFKATAFVSTGRIVDKDYAAGTWFGENVTPNNPGGGVRESGSPFGRYAFAADTLWHIGWSRRAGTTHKVCFDGGASAASGTVSGAALSSAPFYIGSAGSGGAFFLGYIAEVLIYSAAVSDANANKLEGYLAHKWGLTASLPALHPHKTTPP